MVGRYRCAACGVVSDRGFIRRCRRCSGLRAGASKRHRSETGGVLWSTPPGASRPALRFAVEGVIDGWWAWSALGVAACTGHDEGCPYAALAMCARRTLAWWRGGRP